MFSAGRASPISSQQKGQHRPRTSVKKRHFLRCHLCIKCMILPRQARDKHRESTQKRVDGVSLGPQPIVYPSYWLALLWKRFMGTQVLPVVTPPGGSQDVEALETRLLTRGAAGTDPGHGICSQNPTPCGCLRVYVHAKPKAPPGQRLTVCVINLGSTSQDVRARLTDSFRETRRRSSSINAFCATVRLHTTRRLCWCQRPATAALQLSLFYRSWMTVLLSSAMSTISPLEMELAQPQAEPWPRRAFS